MTPKDRIRDGVLKRRRDAKRAREKDDNDDALERKYIRENLQDDNTSNKRAKSSHPKEPLAKTETAAKPLQQQTLKDPGPSVDNQHETTQPTKLVTQTSSTQPLLERQRLKNQQRKARCKAKKEVKAKTEQETQASQQRERENIERERQLKRHEKHQLLQQQAIVAFQPMRMGVQYQDVRVGSGPVVQDRKKVRVQYTLRAKDARGKVVDSNSNFGFRVGRGEVISGWDIGLEGMRQGGVRHLLLPPEAGYGNRNVGAGAGAILCFEVKLLSC